MSTTPSARRRQTTTTTTTTSNDIEIPPLPPYEPPIAPLIPNCQQKLTNLAKSSALKHLHTHIQHAAEKLTDSAGDVNERLTEVREKALRSRKRNRAQFEDGQQDGDGNRGEENEENEEDHRLQKTEQEVKAVTAKLEEGIRRIVDAEFLVDGLSGVLTDLSKEAERDAAASTISASTSTARRLRRRLNPHNDSEEEEEEDDDDEPSQSQPQPQPPTPYTKTLTQKLKTEAANWSNQSLTQRYSTNNTYIGFYRMVHDAKHPGNDIPPLPHASTWFRHLEGAGSSNQTPREGSESDGDGDSGPRAHSIQPKHEVENDNENEEGEEDEEEEEEEELEIASERISLKCPLTLLTFQEPVTSTKCPHSFEKQAILDMISHSSTTVPPSGGGRNRVRAVKCPVCSVLLTAQDLRKDAVLLRRVRRMEAMMQREEDDDEDEDGGGRRRSKGMRKSGITVGSDEDEEDEEEEEEESEEEQPVRIKRERTAG